MFASIVVLHVGSCFADDTAGRVAGILDSTVRIETSRDRSSGVIVSAEGHVLTVAHGLRSNESKVQVLHLGKRYAARLVHYDAANDVAMLAIDKPDSKVFFSAVAVLSEIAFRSLKVGQPLFATGCPAREANSLGPVVRIGKLDARSKQFLRSTCVLTAGDSGGPLVTRQGFLVGINARIGLTKNTNLHVPISVIRQSLQDVKLPRLVTAKTTTVDRSELATPKAAKQALVKRHVEIVDADEKVVCSACRIASNFVVTKLSEIDEKKLRCRTGSVFVSFSVVKSDLANDLALLQLRSENLPPLTRPTPATTELFVGQQVFCGSSKVAIVTRLNHHEPSASPALGCSLQVEQSKIMVQSISANSACSDAGLLAGDELLQFCGRQCESLDDIGDLLAERQPGDRVAFRVLRNGLQLTSAGQLRHQANSLLNRAEFLDGRAGLLSNRRTGFDGVIQHDGHLAGKDIGGPLVDKDGHLVGINIARRARESIVALPIGKVMKFANTAPTPAMQKAD